MTIYSEIPYVTENVDNVYAAINEGIFVTSALTQTCVKAMNLTAPPGGESDGDMYIVASPATGEWAGMENYLARYNGVSASWDFFVPGALAKFVVNMDDNGGYFFNTQDSPQEWVPLSLGT